VNKFIQFGMLSLACLLPSCATLEVKPIKIEPIHVIVDVNVRVDRQLDQFFNFEDQANSTTQPASQPAPQAAPAEGSVPSAA